MKKETSIRVGIIGLLFVIVVIALLIMFLRPKNQSKGEHQQQQHIAITKQKTTSVQETTNISSASTAITATNMEQITTFVPIPTTFMPTNLNFTMPSVLTDNFITILFTSSLNNFTGSTDSAIALGAISIV